MKTLQTITLMLCLMSLFGCVTNGGDIGALYGEWALRSYTVDGRAAEDVDCADYYWQFQGSIVCILQRVDDNESTVSFGTWQQSGNDITLDFSHVNQSDADDTAVFDPPAELGIPGRTATVMHIDKLEGRQMILIYTDADGKLRRYTFDKLS